ncbi:hypothetical protein ACMGDM_01700 [Sphingomonas sp. DT-51]|uniref:hypothetical protein n=1 Tax=Sphingomonas sp. DT-51 TaxID=3396165 RepID=UPI003F196492
MGEQAGADLSCKGSENPYGHEAFGLRLLWFRGFGEGRAWVWKHQGGEPAGHLLGAAVRSNAA